MNILSYRRIMVHIKLIYHISIGDNLENLVGVVLVKIVLLLDYYLE